jgi:protein-disulfide isomerase
LPLPSHRSAFAAAIAAECAADQGRFWDMHDRMFGRQSQLNRLEFVGDAQAIRLNFPAYEQCLDGGTTNARIARDRTEGFRLGVKSTPTFLIGRIQPNGERVKLAWRVNGAVPYGTLEKVLETMLRTQES